MRPKTAIPIPTSTNIAGHEITVAYRENLPENLFGSYGILEKEIVIQADALPSDLVETYVHELIEAVNSIYQLELPHHAIQVLGAGLAQALTSGKGRLR